MIMYNCPLVLFVTTPGVALVEILNWQTLAITSLCGHLNIMVLNYGMLWLYLREENPP